MKRKAVTPKTWQDFRNSGMFFFINSILHAFGWAICIETDTETKEIVGCYPARVKFRGFPEDAQAEEHIKIAKYLAENSHEFVEDAES
jgi:hypothetical protein